VLTGILMIVLLAMVAFAVDIGYILVARNEAQNSADAAALAAVGKLADQLKASPLTNGIPTQLANHITLARDEAKKFANLNKVGTVNPEIEDTEVEFGYLADPYNHSNNTLDTTGWPARPYNAVRVTVKRDKDHTGGPLGLFFARVLGVKEVDVSATATAVFAMGSVTPKASSSTFHGGLLPFTYQIDEWEALLASSNTGNVTVNYAHDPSRSADQLPLTDTHTVASDSNSSDGVSTGADTVLETKLYPDRTTAGNYGTINFTLTKSSNSTNVLRDLIEFGPEEGEWPDLPTILTATEANPKSVNGDPGISAGVEPAVKAIIGQPKILPLYTTRSGTGNNTFYKLVKFVPVVIVDVDLKGGNKFIKMQPHLAAEGSFSGGKRLDFNLTPNGTPNMTYIGARGLVR
jgi:hypothetical protein